MNSPVLLIILDGFGYRKEVTGNAIALAKKPFLDYCFATYPHTLLQASGKAVGLPNGFIGNSEVGHLTIGTGTIIQEPVTILLQTLADGSFYTNPVLLAGMDGVKKAGAKLHILGLLSDAGVHSHEAIMHAFIATATNYGLTTIVHPFLDGRDTPPTSAAHFLSRLEQICTKTGAVMGSLHGRFYAMDRDKHWQRTEQSYQVLTQEQTRPSATWQEVLAYYYAQGITDEFIPPTQLQAPQSQELKKTGATTEKRGKQRDDSLTTPRTFIEPGDGVIFANFRPDRARQLTASFIEPGFSAFPTKKIPLSCFITPYAYAPTLPSQVLLHKQETPTTLTDVLAQAGKRVFYCAETEKYAHVTYFFNGGRERVLPTEQRVLIHSLAVKDYVQFPCMSAPEITKTVLNSLKNDPCDVYIINYANADMVGHSGNLEATIQAIECVDTQLKEIFDYAITKLHGTLYITADHGKAELMADPATGQPLTAHTTNPVPFVLVQQKLAGSTIQLKLTQLADIAPFILQHLGLAVPETMVHR